MKVITCDGCGAVHHGAPGINVKEVRCGLHGSRVLDLCGPCRSEFHAFVSAWLQSKNPVAAAEAFVAEYQGATG